ncbi:MULTISPECIES: hypothetical protein [Polymorphospora]|uniref:Uncharacterized protein n=1 Tax=Polymorphospora lycopeni TaxID=3140240 RepID=A0ABV5CPU9_9ACTN
MRTVARYLPFAGIVLTTWLVARLAVRQQEHRAAPGATSRTLVSGGGRRLGRVVV